MQFNCAEQDWVAYTLLEATLFGCLPLYPAWKDFPRELRVLDSHCIYQRHDLEDAELKLRKLLALPPQGAENAREMLSIVYRRHDKAIPKLLALLGLL